MKEYRREKTIEKFKKYKELKTEAINILRKKKER